MPVQDIVQLRDLAVASRRQYLAAVEPILKLYLKEVDDVWRWFHAEEDRVRAEYRLSNFSTDRRSSKLAFIEKQRNARLKLLDDLFRSALGLPTRDIEDIVRWEWRYGDHHDVLFDD